MKVKSESEGPQSCPTLCDPGDWSPPGSSVPGIFQARILEWVAISFNLKKSSMGFPDNSVGKESACNSGDLGSILGLGRSPGEGKGYPLQYSSLENSVDCIVHGVAKSRLSDFHFDLIGSCSLPALLFPVTT